MRKLFLGLCVILLCATAQAEMPNLYYGPTIDLESEEWGTAGASDLFGKWAFYFTVAMADDGARGGGISTDIMKVLHYCKADYKWGEKVRVKPVYLFLRNFTDKTNHHRVLLAVVEL